jgi:hypothetical protein
MVNVTIAGGTINLLFAVPLIFAEQFVFWANYNKADFLTTVVAFNHQLAWEAVNMIAGKSQHSAFFVVLAYTKFNSGDCGGFTASTINCGFG